jgi:FkbM family methyltransferase
MQLSLYTIKKTLLWPRTAIRRRSSKDLDRVGRAMFEVQYYRRAMYDFVAASAEKPDLLVDADLDEQSTVIDAGAYDGDWSEQISQRYGSRIYAFEPDPTSFRRLTARVADERNVVACEFGLSDHDHDATLALDGPGSAVSTAPGHFGAATVRLRDVVGVLDELGIESIDLLKVNIEGGEFDLFDRLIGAGWLPRIRVVSIQFHEWHPHAYRRRRAVRRALRRDHTEVWCYPWVWELWRRTGR